MTGTVIGRGVIEVSADSTKLKAGVDDAKRSIKSLGDSNKDASAKASASVDRYIKRLQQQNVTTKMTVRETELYKLSLRGASKAQLDAADSALKMKQRLERNAEIGSKIRVGLTALAAAGIAASGAMLLVVNNQAKQIASYQGLAEKIGDTAVNVASLQAASDISGVSLDTLATASVRLTKSLADTNDEGKQVAKAIKALGLDFQTFKRQSPVEQIDAISKAMAGFADGSQKTAVAVALFGRAGADLIPILNDLAGKGKRQTILTAEQIKQADDYTKAQAALRSEFQTFIKMQSAEALPALTAVSDVLADIARNEVAVSVATDTLKAALGGAIVIFQTIAILGANVGFVFLGVGREIGAIAAQLAALARLDFKGFRAISEAVKEDGERAREELDRFEKRIMGIGANTPVDDELTRIRNRAAGANAKPTINTDGLSQDTAPKAASARFTAELDTIKRASESVRNVYADSERILEARRSASLIKDKEYYEAKRGFININAQAEAAALEQQIKVLQKETLSGKEKIANDGKIADAQERLAKARASAVASLEILGVQETAANTKVAQSYVDATRAAQTYIDTINRQNAREIEGIGKGGRFRQEQSDRNQIEDKFTGQRQGLEGDLRRGQISEADFKAYLRIAEDTYAAEIAAYDNRTAAIREKQGDWLNGASEAFANYKSNAENVAASTASMFENTFEGMTDGVSSSVSQAIVYGKSLEDSLKNVAVNVADAFIASFIKIQIQRLFIDKTAAASYAGTIALQSQAMAAMAGLNAFASTAAIPIVGPALAPAAGAAALAIAEGFAATATSFAAMSVASARGGFDIPAGQNPLTQLHEREMVLPAPQADVIRDLAKSGGGSSGGQITIINQTKGNIGKVTERQGQNGERALILEEAVEVIAAQMGDPNSKVSRSMGRNFSVQRSR